jgi:hypothetical protein
MSKIDYGTDRISLSIVVEVGYAVGSRWRAAGQERSPLSRGQAWPCALRLCCIYARMYLPIHPTSEICAICGFFLAFSDNSEHSILCFPCLAVAALLRSNTTKNEALATARIGRGIQMQYDIRNTKLSEPALLRTRVRRINRLKPDDTYAARVSCKTLGSRNAIR